jgi:quercetin dioxygenase-like cupin family protein
MVEAAMESGVTLEFETTEFAGIKTRILNPYPSAFTMLEMTIQPGYGAPAHVSVTEDKLFIVLSGEIKYRIGEETHLVPVGARVQVARGVVHGFTNVGADVAKHILVSTPRRHEEFFRDMQNAPEPRLEHIPAIAAKNGQEIVGPLP